jgi:hypothetical protein
VAWGALLLPALLAAGAAMAAKNISTTSNLAFGRFAAAGGGGSVHIAAGGARTHSGAVILLSSSATAAAFAIAGNDNKVTHLTLPANGAVKLISGANQMNVINFVSSAQAGGVLAPGVGTVKVGASLQVAPNQARGTYSGAFQVTLDFN